MAKIEKDPEVQIENSLGRFEMWLEKSWKTIALVVGAILVVIAIFWGYDAFVKAPRARKAADAMYVAEQLFAAGDFEAALNGGDSMGFISIYDTYKTNLAAHYAGVCYIRLGDWDNALDYLGRYNPTKGVPNALINAQNVGLRGDAHVQKGEYEKAVGCFKDAAGYTNSLTTPVYLKKLGLAMEQTGDLAGALEAYQRISVDYASSLEARDIEKYISGVKQRL